MIAPDGTTFVTRFSSAELNYVTVGSSITAISRWQPSPYPRLVDLKASAAERNGTLIQIEPKHTRTFTVTTGIA